MPPVADPSPAPEVGDRRHSERRIALYTDLARERRHGERRHYQAGCRCLPCRAANAQYLAHWRRLRVEGRAPLGRLVPATRVHTWMKVLRLEHFRRADVMRAIGHHPANYAHLRQRAYVTLRTAVRLARVYRTRVLENPDEAVLGVCEGIPE